MGWNLRETLPPIRRARGLTQAALGELAAIPRTDVVAIEKGRLSVGAVRLQRLVDALGVSRVELVPEAEIDVPGVILQNRLAAVEATVERILDDELVRLVDQVRDLSHRVARLEVPAPPRTEKGG